MSTATRRPLKQMALIAEELRHLLEPACIQIEIAGSIRRCVPMVADIELVAIPKIETYEETDPSDLFGSKRPATYNLLWKSLNSFFKGKYRVSGDKMKSFYWPIDGQNLVQVDLFTATPATWGWIYLIRTGSADFSHHVARQLNLAGYTSKEGAIHVAYEEMVDGARKLVAAGGPLATTTEEEVFRLARMPIRAPHQRT